MLIDSHCHLNYEGLVEDQGAVLDRARMERVLATLCGCIRDLAVAISPVTPRASSKILDALCIPADARDFAALAADSAEGEIRVDNPSPVFPRLEMPEEAPA